MLHDPPYLHQEPTMEERVDALTRPLSRPPYEGHDIFVVIPLSWNMTPREFTSSIEGLRRYYPKVTTVYSDGATIGASRNEGVRCAREAGARKVLFLDADMAWQGDPLTSLLARRLPVVGALCRGRRRPFPAMLWRAAGRESYERFPPDGDGLIEVDATGGAFLLVDMEVFDKLDAAYPNWPYFVCRETLVTQHDPDAHNQAPAQGTFHMSEDIWFCRQVRSLDIPIYVDQSVKVGHLVTCTIIDGPDHEPQALFL